MEIGTFLVERYLVGADAAVAEALGDRLAEATAALRAEGGTVTWLGSVALPGEESCLCLFHGLERDVVAANLRAGAPFDRVMRAAHVAPRSGPKCRVSPDTESRPPADTVAKRHPG